MSPTIAGAHPAPAPPGTTATIAASRLRGRAAALKAGDWAALGFLVLLGVAITAPRLLSGYDPLEAAPGQTLQAPSWEHPFGTDYLGRDAFARLVHGTGRTLGASVVAVAIGLGAGALLGLVAAYFGRWVDGLVSRIVDVLLSIPGLLLSMVVVVALGFGTLNAAIAVGIASVATFTRLMRSEVLTVRNLPFIEAAHHIGAGPRAVLFRHVLPNSYTAVLSMTALQFGSSILWIAALSFLGYGAPPPEPEWGLLVAEGREYIVSSPWLTVLPGVVIVLTVLSISRASALFRDTLGDVK